MGKCIRPATPLDMVRLSVPPAESLRLDLARQLLAPHHPWRGFLLTWMGLGQPLHTLLRWGEHGLLACVQAQANDSWWEVCYLAVWKPALGQAAALWEELLLALGQEAGRHGAVRMLARLPSEGHLPPFQQAGFVPFAEETILLWDGATAPVAETLSDLLPMQPHHLDAVQQLRLRLTPPIAQHAEGVNSDARGPYSAETWVWPADEDIHACLQRWQGPQGTLLAILLEPAFRQQAAAILAHGLVGSTAPVYLTLRSYQGELLEVARRLGFRPCASQLLLVKHLAVRVEERQLAARPAERHLGAAPSTPAVGKTLSMDKALRIHTVPVTNRRQLTIDDRRRIALIG